MSNKEIYNLLKGLNIKVAYDHFNSKVEPPFVIYTNDDDITFKADDKVYSKTNTYTIDLITDNKDIELEEQLETLLNNNNIPYEKTSDFIADEKIYQIEYSI